MRIINTVLRKIIFVCFLTSLSGCTSLFFQPEKNHIFSPDEYGVNYQDVFFNSIDDTKLHGWWFSATNEPKATVVFIQGNFGNISIHAPAIHWLTEYDYDVFMFDYRGYGKSEGVAFLQGVLNDVSQAILYAANKKTSHTKLFVIGQSLGASMGIFSLSKMKEGVDGAVFVSPFSDYREITRHMLSKRWLTWAFQWPLSLTINNDYRPLDFVSRISPVPTLFLYSDSDEVVPSGQTKALYEKANSPKNIEEVVGTHNEIMGIQENREIIVKYLDEWSK